MKAKVFFLLIAVVLSLNLVSMVSAEIIISQPATLYNIGDDFSTNLEVSKSMQTNDFLLASLQCGSGSVEIYRNPLNLAAGEKRVINITARLDKTLISNLEGSSCNLQVSYNGELSKSSDFEITSKININANLKDALVDPRQQISISGFAKKADSKSVQGFVELSLPIFNNSILGSVIDGNFN